LLALLQFDQVTAEALRTPSATVDSTSVVLPPFRDWLVDLIPANPLKAATMGIAAAGATGNVRGCRRP